MREMPREDAREESGSVSTLWGQTLLLSLLTDFAGVLSTRSSESAEHMLGQVETSRLGQGSNRSSHRLVGDCEEEEAVCFRIVVRKQRQIGESSPLTKPYTSSSMDPSKLDSARICFSSVAKASSEAWGERASFSFGPKTLGKKSGTILPRTKLASVSARGPPFR